MKKQLITLLWILPVSILLTSFKPIPGYSIKVEDNTSATSFTVTLNYYDASHNVLATHSHSLAPGGQVTDVGPSPFTTTASFSVSLTSGVSTLDFWDNSLFWSGGCVSTYPSSTVTSASFSFNTSYLSYILFANNVGCR